MGDRSENNQVQPRCLFQPQWLLYSSVPSNCEQRPWRQGLIAKTSPVRSIIDKGVSLFFLLWDVDQYLQVLFESCHQTLVQSLEVCLISIPQMRFTQKNIKSMINNTLVFGTLAINKYIKKRIPEESKWLINAGTASCLLPLHSSGTRAISRELPSKSQLVRCSLISRVSMSITV